MSIDIENLHILHYPKPILRQKTAPVKEVTDEIRQVAAKMIELMHEATGVGLAAPQVGLDLRMFVCNHTGEQGDDCVYINPQFTELSRVTEARNEGCLSLPGIEGDVTRPVSITIVAIDLDNQQFQKTASDLEARVWQHETDHLDGVLIIDHLKRLDKMANKSALRELEKNG